MACELVQREFTKSDGEKILVVVRQLAASKSLDLYVELMNKMGTSVLPLIDNKHTFGDLITVMRAHPDSTVVTELIKRVVCTSTIENAELKPALFDLHFNGELMVALQVFAFVLEANFKDFFAQGRALNAQRSSEAEALSKTEELKNSNQPET